MSQSASHDGPRFLLNASQGPRAEQQDSGICLHNDVQGTALLVVGDGVGGRSGGRIASQKATEMASELWEERKGNLAKPAEDLAMLCQVAHEHINSEGAKLGISPRTTIVAMYLTPTHAWWVHSGDSRLYHFRAGELVERTEDHSLLEMMVQRGAVKEEDMGSHPDQNTLLQSLGGEEFVSPSTGDAEITPDDGFLLCTDGFWERTTPEEMAALVYAERAGVTGSLEQAVERAVERNGPKGDNVTVALALPARVKVVVAPMAPRQNVALLAGAAVMLLLAALLFFWPEHRKPAASEEPAIPRAVPVERTPTVEATSPKTAPVEKPIAPQITLPSDPPLDRSTPSVGPTPIAVPLHPFRPENAVPAEPRKPKPKDYSIRDSSLDDRPKPAN
ncbi:MAG: protein phosphatase 2C domain-containing protein [Chthoniobacter sp.]|uniref:PP2C family protein-serine/threonine phosphatase n=1 Tax=Chthoniobacter sp. TaxID=2510640 RepID=UPI0032A1A95E